MPATQMNLRIDSQLKADGDAVLSRYGISPSRAIRSLWRHLVAKQSLPDFIRNPDAEAQESDETLRAKLARIEAGEGMAATLARQEGIDLSPSTLPSYKEMREGMYECKLSEYEVERHA